MPPGPLLRARRPGGAIRSLPFRHNVKPALGFEIFRLSHLHERAAFPAK